MFDGLALFESPAQWAIVLLIVVFLFGGSKIPEIMRGLGSGMKEFKKGMREEEEEERSRRKTSSKAAYEDEEEEQRPRHQSARDEEEGEEPRPKART